MVRLLLGVIVFVFTPANVGEAPECISCMVLTAPLVTLKLVALKLAMPLVLVEASLIVMVLPAAEALAIEIDPERPLRDVTPLLGQLPLERQIVPLTSGSV